MDNFCPVCKNEIDSERLAEGISVCQSCGWSSTKTNEALEKRLNRKTSLSLFFTAGLLVALFIHNANWGGYSLEIIPLKIMQKTDLATQEELFRIGEICKAVKKNQCLEDAYKDAFFQDRGNHKLMELYADVLVKTRQPDKALLIYKSYFSQNGKNLEAAYQYAKILGHKGRVKESARMFRFVLDSKKGTLQISVLHSFVDMYTKNNRLQSAKKLIQEVKKLGTNTRYFMDNKLKTIKRKISRR